MHDTVQANKYYLVRFKGYKLDKAWENPRICRAHKPHLDPKLRMFEFYTLGHQVKYITTFGATDFKNFEIIKEISEELAMKYYNRYCEVVAKRDQDLKNLVTKYDNELTASLMEHQTLILAD